MGVVIGKIEGDVVPSHRRRSFLERDVECGECVVILMQAEIGGTQADVEIEVVGRDFDGGLIFLLGRVILLLLKKKAGKIGVRVLIQRIDFDLLLELRDSIFVATKTLVGEAKVVVGVPVIRVFRDGLLQSRDGFSVILHFVVGVTESIPNIIVVGIFCTSRGI